MIFYLVELTLGAYNKCTHNFGKKREQTDKSDMQYWDCLPHNWDELPYSLQIKHLSSTTYSFIKNSYMFQHLTKPWSGCTRFTSVIYIKASWEPCHLDLFLCNNCVLSCSYRGQFTSFCWNQWSEFPLCCSIQYRQLLLWEVYIHLSLLKELLYFWTCIKS